MPLSFGGMSLFLSPRPLTHNNHSNHGPDVGGGTGSWTPSRSGGGACNAGGGGGGWAAPLSSPLSSTLAQRTSDGNSRFAELSGHWEEELRRHGSGSMTPRSPGLLRLPTPCSNALPGGSRLRLLGQGGAAPETATAPAAAAEAGSPFSAQQRVALAAVSRRLFPVTAASPLSAFAMAGARAASAASQATTPPLRHQSASFPPVAHQQLHEEMLQCLPVSLQQLRSPAPRATAAAVSVAHQQAHETALRSGLAEALAYLSPSCRRAP